MTYVKYQLTMENYIFLFLLALELFIFYFIYLMDQSYEIIKFKQNKVVCCFFRSVSFIMVTACFAFILLTILYLIIDVAKIWNGTPFIFPGTPVCLIQTVLYVCTYKLIQENALKNILTFRLLETKLKPL